MDKGKEIILDLLGGEEIKILIKIQIQTLIQIQPQDSSQSGCKPQTIMDLINLTHRNLQTLME